MNETVGLKFNADDLIEARDITLKVITAASKLIKPGLTEDDLKTEIIKIQERLGVTQTWHPPQIRFGVNTILPFGVPGVKNIQLQKDDILFLDLGLVFKDHEGDVGRPFYIGENLQMKKCCEDAKHLWCLVRDEWFSSGKSGEDLYEFAKIQAENLGWILSLKKADGHRVADFPHIAKTRGSVIGCQSKPMENRWILEIQIVDPSHKFGAFYEDILN